MLKCLKTAQVENVKRKKYTNKHAIYCYAAAKLKMNLRHFPQYIDFQTTFSQIHNYVQTVKKCIQIIEIVYIV